MLPILVSLLPGLCSGEEDVRAVLHEMQQAFRQSQAIHARLVIQETLTGAEPRELHQELWIDPVRGRVRSEVRDPRRPEPHLTLIAGPQGLLLYHADAREVAQQPGPLDLGAALDSTLAGELWRTAFRGDLAGMKVESYGAPRLGGEEAVGGVPCRKVEFPGNQTSTLWLAREDHLPRRLQGALPGMVRREEVRFLQRPTRLPEECFRFLPREGVKVVPLVIARQSWSTLPPERERWPAVGASLPTFQALGPDGEPRTAADLPVPCVLAFWFQEHPTVRAALTQVEVGLEEALLPLVSVHPGKEPADRKLLDPGLELCHEVWLDGATPQRPFWAFAIATCPVFFLVDENGKIHTATDEADNILAAARNFDGAP